MRLASSCLSNTQCTLPPLTSFGFDFEQETDIRTMASQVVSWLRKLLEQSDPAALLPDPAVKHMAAELADGGVTAMPPFMGSEDNPHMLVHPVRECACKAPRAVHHSKGSWATILDVTGPLRKTHVPLICLTAGCKFHGKYHWHNYLSDDGKHIFQGNAATHKCFMINYSFGVTTGYLQQLHFRMVREHASFKG